MDKHYPGHWFYDAYDTDGDDDEFTVFRDDLMDMYDVVKSNGWIDYQKSKPVHIIYPKELSCKVHTYLAMNLTQQVGLEMTSLFKTTLLVCYPRFVFHKVRG